MEETLIQKKRQSAVGWLLGQAGDHRGKYTVSVCTAVLGVAFSLAPYFLAANLIHQLLAGNKEVRYYLVQCLLIAVFWAGRVLCHGVSTSFSHQATFHVLANVRKQCTDKLARMPLGAVLDQPSGALKSTLVERIDTVETPLAHILPEFTANLLAPVCIIVFLFMIDWRMALVSLITLPIGFLCYMGMMIGYEGNYKRAIRATKNLNDTAVEYINGIEVIKVFGKAESSYERFVEAAGEAADSYISWMRKSNVYFTFAMNVMPSTMVTVLPIGGFMVKNGFLTPENLIFIIILSVAMITPILTCMSYSDDIGTMGTVVKEIRGVLDAPEMERPAAMEHIPANHSIRLSGVRFSYHDTEVVHGIDMEIPEGSFTALVGPSGSGKSTVARLINALWDVKEGTITLGGVDIRSIPLEEYSDLIAYVSQDNYLFNQSVRENIRMGKTSAQATDAEVEEAAKRCGCHEFIMGLENGYDTVVGSLGGHLSGGERQRISIARAMLKNAPIVILDEATAYTDPENEALIQNSVAKLVKDKTLIVIAHRLSTIKDADQIYVVNDGRIGESGTHSELLGLNGLYKKMWDAHVSARDHMEEAVPAPSTGTIKGGVDHD